VETTVLWTCSLGMCYCLSILGTELEEHCGIYCCHVFSILIEEYRPQSKWYSTSACLLRLAVDTNVIAAAAALRQKFVVKTDLECRCQIRMSCVAF